MAPKSKKTNQKLSIGDFLNDQSLGSWADEMDSQPLPATTSSGFGGERRAFSTTSGFGGDRAGVGQRFGDRGFAEGTRRDQLPLPDKPPFTAHLGNLSFEVTEGDVQDFLSGCEVTSVRIVEDKLDHRPKGFGYVEFRTLDGLKKALELSETQFQGRNIRVSVADPPKDRGEAREISDWSRKGPLPDLPGQGMRRSSERQGPGRSFDAASDAGSERGPRRTGFFEGDGKSRDFADWSRKGPLSPPPQAEPRQGGRTGDPRGPPPERRPSPSWGEARSGEGRSDAGSRPPRPERVPTAADSDNQWRSRMRPDAPSPAATPDVSSPSSPVAAAAPAARPRLNLAKRTVSEAPPAGDSPSSAGGGGSSIFGGAKPIDTSKREQEIEQKRQESIKAKKEADDKAREEKRARETAANLARADARAEKSAPAAEKESAKDSAASTPRENGNKPTDRKESDATSPAAPGRQYEILRRMEQEDDGDRDGPDASANGDIVADKETKPQEVVREKPVDSGAWKQQESTGEALEDDGFTVVQGDKKKGRRNNNAGSRALAS